MPPKKLQPPAHVLPMPVKTSLEPMMAENLCAGNSLHQNKGGAPCAPGSQPSDQPKRGRGRPRKNLNACVQERKSDQPRATLEGAGKDEEHICPLCQEIILEATSDREGYEAVFCDGVSCCVWYHRWCAGVTNKRYESLAGSEVRLA